MIDYYKNLTELDLNNVLDLNSMFTVWDTYYNAKSKDLYFIGLKRGSATFEKLTPYSDVQVTCTSSNIPV